jgi:hypothetical protein
MSLERRAGAANAALGFGSAALGLIAGWAGLSSVFLTSALAVLGAAMIALRRLDVPLNRVAG